MRIPTFSRARSVFGYSWNDMARQIHFLKVENRMLRAKLPKRIPITPEERCRLVKFGQPLGTRFPNRAACHLRAGHSIEMTSWS